jgi:DCN1-like protein 1/2
MERLSSQQQSVVRQFGAISGVSQQAAIHLLEAHQWQLHATITTYAGGGSFGGGEERSETDEAALTKEFGKYKDEENGFIGVDGIYSIIEDLGCADESDPALLVFAFHCEAATMAELTRDEFKRGMRALGVSTVFPGLRGKLSQLRAELQDPASFKEIYAFAFAYNKEPLQKSISQDTAEAVWELLMKEKFNFYDAWMLFLQREHNKPISRDTWVLLLHFANQTNEELSNYGACGAASRRPLPGR